MKAFWPCTTASSHITCDVVAIRCPCLYWSKSSVECIETNSCNLLMFETESAWMEKKAGSTVGLLCLLVLSNIWVLSRFRLNLNYKRKRILTKQQDSLSVSTTLSLTPVKSTRCVLFSHNRSRAESIVFFFETLNFIIFLCANKGCVNSYLSYNILNVQNIKDIF